ncbi:MAG TPA: 4Fe-4S dicluster domain-containing protein, partial [Candidatus Limnocylindria bacterium]|nr:4Fe-4S dicluster domain-containing protein [Candidatus Limnocylindria bacterium]
MAILVDTSRCTGCRACMVACKEWNELPAEDVARTLPGSYQNRDGTSAATWTVVRFAEQASGDGMRWLFAKTQCMHCGDAPCVTVCPTGAMQKDGTATYLDESKCVGEGYCVIACPFGAVALDASKGIVQKCTMCIDRV